MLLIVFVFLSVWLPMNKHFRYFVFVFILWIYRMFMGETWVEHLAHSKVVCK